MREQSIVLLGWCEYGKMNLVVRDICGLRSVFASGPPQIQVPADKPAVRQVHRFSETVQHCRVIFGLHEYVRICRYLFGLHKYRGTCVDRMMPNDSTSPAMDQSGLEPSSLVQVQSKKFLDRDRTNP